MWSTKVAIIHGFYLRRKISFSETAIYTVRLTFYRSNSSTFKARLSSTQTWKSSQDLSIIAPKRSYIILSFQRKSQHYVFCFNQTMFTNELRLKTQARLLWRPWCPNQVIDWLVSEMETLLIWSWGITAGFEKTLPCRFSHLQLVNCQLLVGRQFAISAGITLDRSNWIAYNRSVQPLYVPHNLKNINSHQIK